MNGITPSRLKLIIAFVWGAAILFRGFDLIQALKEPETPGLTYRTAWIQADILAIALSCIVLAVAMLTIGKARKAWLYLSILIVVSKIAIVLAEARVGDLPAADLALLSLATFILPGAVLYLLQRGRDGMMSQE